MSTKRLIPLSLSYSKGKRPRVRRGADRGPYSYHSAPATGIRYNIVAKSKTEAAEFAYGAQESIWLRYKHEGL